MSIDTSFSKYWSWVIDGKQFSQGFTVQSARFASFSPAFTQLFVCTDICEESFISISIIYTQVNLLTHKQKHKHSLSGSGHSATLYVHIYLMQMWLEKPNVKHAGQPSQEGNQLFLKLGFINIAKRKACSKEDKQDSKMLSSFPGAHSLFTIPITGPDPSRAEPF